MTTGILHLFDSSRFISAAGGITSATVYFYYSGTNTLAPVFTDAGLTLPSVNPFPVASGAILPKLYLTPGIVYRRRVVFEDGTVQDIDPIRSESGVGDVATSRTELAAIVDKAAGMVVWLSEGGRSGFFVWNTYAAPAVDPLQGIYVSATGGHFARVWDGPAKAEWFGAVAGATGVDSVAAINAAVLLCKDVLLGVGTYYGTGGIVQPDYSTVRGSGFYRTTISINNPTAHLWAPIGATSNGVTLRDISLDRSVAPSNGTDEENDKTLAHGLHCKGVTDGTFEFVFTKNNLCDFYFNNTINVQAYDCTGERVLAGVAGRYYGTWIDGDNSTIGGTSANHSLRTRNIKNYASAVGLSQAWGLYGDTAISDLFSDYYECALMHRGVFLNLAGEFSAFNARIDNAVLDRFSVSGVHITGAGRASQIRMGNLYAQGTAGMTGNPIYVHNSTGVEMPGLMVSVLPGQVPVSLDGAKNCKLSGQTRGGSNSVVGVNCERVKVDISAVQPSGASSAGSVFVFTASTGVSIAANIDGDAASWGAGVELFGGANANCTIDATGIKPGVCSLDIVIAGSVVMTQGNVAGHVVINPGAGAML